MSRRRGEFEHRTSIFEGAFRAWSHLGGLDPEDLEISTANDLDPLSNPIGNDTRLVSGKKGEHREPALNLDGSKRREYPYEPLPRAGLAHPYVQAILSPWLGPDADNDAIQLGLTTLRTWWQHRRKGESGSAIAALGTEKMKGVVEGYTRHFFTLAHCLIINDKEQPPRSLQSKMKELEKVRSKRNKKRSREEEAGKDNLMGLSNDPQLIIPTADSSAIAAGLAADLTNKNLTPLERLHVAQQRQLAVEGGIHTKIQVSDVVQPINPTPQIICIKNKCVPGKPDLPAIVEAVNRQAGQLSHSGGSARRETVPVPSAVTSNAASGGSSPGGSQYGDPDTVPIIFISENGDVLLSMVVDGITCAHCVKIVETVLKGCNGNKSPIDGLLDAAADRVLCSVLMKIDKIGNAKRVAFEAARNLAMVGYTAKAKEMPSSIEQDGKKVDVNSNQLFNAFDTVARSDPRDIFDWSIPCSCPDNGVLRDDCSRHGQMSTSIFEAFDGRQQMVGQFLSGAKLEPPSQRQQNQGESHQQMQQRQQVMNNPFQQPQNGMPQGTHGLQPLNSGMDQNHVDLDSFDGSSGMGAVGLNDGEMMMLERRAQRNPSIISFGGNGLRHMSFTSEAQSFGRAMSGLSALSIDWENMDDFDINVDHSSHINTNGAGGASPNDGIPSAVDGAPLMGAAGRRRSSLRRSFVANPDQGDPHVSFKV